MPTARNSGTLETQPHEVWDLMLILSQSLSRTAGRLHVCSPPGRLLERGPRES